MPLGSGYTAEEQLTGKAEHGGLQVAVYPMKRKVFERRFPQRSQEQERAVSRFAGLDFCLSAAPDMGLAPAVPCGRRSTTIRMT